jgi:hypothetical protein
MNYMAAYAALSFLLIDVIMCLAYAHISKTKYLSFINEARRYLYNATYKRIIGDFLIENNMIDHERGPLRFL